MNVKQTVYGVLPAQLVTSAKGRAIGPDLSHWELTYDPDLGTSKPDFAFTKATEGLTWIDPSLDAIWTGIDKLDIRGLYHYQRSGMSWRAQAEHFLSVSNDYSHHILALDVEGTNNTLDDTFFQDSFRILQYLKEFSKSKILLYTSLNIFQNYLYPSWVRSFGKAGETEALTIPFWLAQYWYNPSPDKDPGTPKQRSTWDFWQWTETGNSAEWGAGGKAVDLNVFNGNREALYSWVGITSSEPTPDPEPLPIPTTPQTENDIWKGTVVTTSRVNVRSYPEVDVDFLTGQYVTYGQTFLGKLWSGNGYVWMQVTDPTSPLDTKWIAVRSIDGTVKLLSLQRPVFPNPNPDPAPLPETGEALWRVKHDIEYGSVWRPGLPQVHPLFPAPSTKSGSHYSPFLRWAQILSRVMNPLVTNEVWTKIYWHNYWMTNFQGFGMVNDPRANFVTGADLTKSPPKVESLTCGGSLLQGTQFGDWVKVKGLDYNTPVTEEFLKKNPQFWTRGTYASASGIPYRMLGHKFGGSALIHPLLINSKYELWIQAYKLQRWTTGDIPDPIRLYLK